MINNYARYVLCASNIAMLYIVLIKSKYMQLYKYIKYTTNLKIIIRHRV